MGCTLNQDGHVVVAGGMGLVVDGGDPDREPMDSVEIYNPLNDIWAPGDLAIYYFFYYLVLTYNPMYCITFN